MRATIAGILTTLLTVAAAAAQTGSPSGLAATGNRPGALNSLANAGAAATFKSSGPSPAGPSVADRLTMPVTGNQAVTLSVSSFQSAGPTAGDAGKNVMADTSVFNARHGGAAQFPALTSAQTMGVQRSQQGPGADQSLSLPIRP